MASRVATRMICAVLLSACGSSTPAPAERPIVEAAAPAVVADAAAPDADVPDEVSHAAAWVFRYDAAGRLETWTLRHHGGTALLVVESTHTTRYVGTISDGPSQAVRVASGPNQLALDCKPAKQAIGATCGAKQAKPVDVLECFHRDFKSPMTFGPAPGVAYVATEGCTGYQLIK